MSGVRQELRPTASCPAITEAVRGITPSTDGLVNVWIKYDSPAADFVRAHEAAIFPEVTELLNDEVEQQCMFSAIVDVADERVLHASRMSGPLIRRGNGDGPSGSGFVIIDELVAEDAGQDAAVAFEPGLSVAPVALYVRADGAGAAVARRTG